MNLAFTSTAPRQTPWINNNALLADIVAADRGFVGGDGIIEALGDSYLCAFNPLYRTIRRASLASGVSFSTSSTPLYADYNLLPLLMIQDIIDHGIVPVFDNAGALRRILDKSPRLAGPPAFLLLGLRRNHLLHESAHSVAYKVLSPLVRTQAPDEKRWYVLVCLLCEAYANSVERLAAFSADSDIHRLFFALNSYVDDVAGKPQLLAGCLPVLGLEATLLLSIFVFLQLNRQGQWSKSDIQMLVACVRPRGTDDTKAFVMEMLAERFASSLNTNFVTVTTPVFFRHIGCEREYSDICRGEFISDACNGQEFNNRLQELVAVTFRETVPSNAIATPATIA